MITMKNIYILFSICLLTTTVKAQIPVLNSKPSSQNVIYLDFDGEVVNNPNWYASTINAAPSGLTNDQIVETFKRITEKYIPFDVNITTSLAVYNAALATKRQQVVVTPTSQWYGSAGGVAFVGSFGWAAYSPAWVFPNNLSNNADFIATAAAHEVGHTLLLNHHAPYDASCNRIGFYHQGKGTGQTSWGPIMGAPYYSNFVVWYKGSTTSPTCAQTNQDDLALITSLIPYRNDDHGNTIAAATTLNIVSNAFADSGIIERNTDADFFKFTLTQSSNVTVNARPWSLNPATNTAACLDTKVELFNNSGMLLVADSSITTLNSSITQNNLSAGTYYVKIDGTGIANYNDYGGTGPNDYGSLGRFYINAIITPNGGGPTPPVANFNTSVNTICTGQSILCSDISSNTPTSWSWTCTGATPSTSTSQNPTFTFLAAGTYNISLAATNSGGSNTYTKQVTVNPNPVITATNQTMCSGSTISISATGASTYSWMPATGLAQTTGATVNCTAPSNTTYTITGTGSNGCMATKTITVTVNASPNLTSNNPSVCNGQGATLTVSGAITYTWAPSTALNSTTGSSVISTATSNTTYTITGTASNGCTSAKTSIVSVNAAPSLTVSSATAICNGTNTPLTVSGANTYSWTPATGLNNVTSSTVTASPVSSITYTVTGSSGNGCSSQSTVAVTVNAVPSLTGSNNTALCNGTSTNLNINGANTYSWAPAAGLNNITASTVTASPTSSVTYTVTGTSANGCSSSKTIAITVNQTPNLNLTPNAAVCSGNAASLSASGASTYAWSPSTGLSNTSGATISATPASTTTYTVVGTTSGCSTSSTVVVTINTTPVLTSTPNTSVCNGSAATLSVSGASTYSWSPSTGLSAVTGSTVAASPTANITYTITGTSNGCSATKTIAVGISSSPSIVATNTSPQCTSASGSINVNVNGATAPYSYNWNNGATTQNLSNLTAGVYTLTVISANGCSSSSTISLASNTCNIPVTMVPADITSSSVLLRWNKVPCSYGYCIRRRVMNSTNWVCFSMASANDTTRRFFNLIPDTLYEYQILSYCNPEKTDSSGYSSSNTFTTNALCFAPQNLNVTQVSSNGAIIEWNTMPSSTAYRLRYTISGTTPNWVEVVIPEGNQNNYLIDGLQAGTKYKYQIRNVCDASIGEVSNWSSSKFFTTTDAGNRFEEVGEEANVFDFDLYPNPATRFVSIDATIPEPTDITVNIYDVTGRMMETFIRNVEDGHFYEEIDLTTYMKGIYVVSINYSGQTINKKFVRR